MVTESLACPACANEVPRGRLSCPHCGSVLAAVARSYRDEPLNAPGAWIPPALPAEPEPDPIAFEADREPEPEADSVFVEDTPSDAAVEPAAIPGWGVPGGTMTQALPVSAPARPIPDVLHRPSVEPPPARILPRPWNPNSPDAAASSSEAKSGARRGIDLPSFGGIDRARIGGAADTLVAIGSLGTVIGMLVPWVPLGARGVSAWPDRWGLGLPGHLIVFLLACGALALATIPNEIGRWLRTGLVGVALGALVLGLTWRFAFGAPGGGFGIPLTFVAGSVLLIGGLVAAVVHRHEGAGSGV